MSTVSSGPTSRGWPEDVRIHREREHSQRLLASQKRVLELLAGTASLEEVLEAIVRIIEEQSSGAAGVICLVVDFTTGCIYECEGSAANDLAEDPRRAIAEVDLDGHVVARADLDGARRAQLAWVPHVDEPGVRARGRLVLRDASGRVAAAQIRELIPHREPLE